MERFGNPYTGLLVTLLFVMGVAGWVVFSHREEYPGPWMSDSNASIRQLITENFVQDCDEFYYRHRRDSNNTFADYLVRCTANGVTWNDYLVVPSTKSLLQTDDYKDLPFPQSARRTPVHAEGEH